MFIGRRDDGSIYGAWTVQQWKGQEELPESNPELQAFVNRPIPKVPTLVADLKAALILKGVITEADVKPT